MAHRILLVEDDSRFAQQLSSLLQFHGHRVFVAYEGGVALELFEEEEPDLVLTEMMLPDTTGPALVEVLRTFPGGADVPVLMMSQTYHTGAKFEDDLQRLGVLAFLHKPFSVTDLGRRVARILGGRDDGRAEVRELVARGPAKRRAPTKSGSGGTAEVSLPSLGKPVRAVVSAATREVELPSVGRSSASFPPVAPGRSAPSQPVRSLPERRLTATVWVETVGSLFHDGASGVLRVKSDDATRKVFFLNGYPVWAEVEPPLLGCAEYLLRKERISEEQSRQIADKQVRLGWSTQRVLVAMQLLTVQEMDQLLQGWVEDEFAGVLGRKGTVEFRAGDRFAEEIPVYELNPISALWGGLSKSLRLGTAEVGLARAEGRYLRRRRSRDRLFGYIATSTVLQEVRDWLAGSRSFESIRDYFASDWEEVARCLWTAVHAGIVEITDEPEDDEVSLAGMTSLELVAADGDDAAGETMRFDRETVEALLREGPHDVDAPDLDDPEVRIIHDYVSKMDRDHYAFLGVGRDASLVAINEAYERLAPFYRPGRPGDRIQGDVRRKAKELLSRLGRAWKVLSDPDQRQTYDRELSGDSAWWTGEADGDSAAFEVEVEVEEDEFEIEVEVELD
jgi:CheY-like chemotaxis protein